MSYLSARWNVIGWNKYWPVIFGPAFLGYLIGKKIDDVEKDRSTTFRDKSSLFGGNVKPGEDPSW